MSGDPRFLGTEQRRRMGAESSHLGMIPNGAPMTPKPFWSKAGSAPTSPNPNVPDYSTGSSNAEGDQRLVAGNNAYAVSPVTAAEPRATAFHRSAMESNGARLTISPSMKIPQNDPASGMTQVNTRFVASRAGRSSANFYAGMAD